MLQIHFTTADFARIRIAPRPAPLLELNTAFMKMASGDNPLLFGRWRQRLLRSLPPAVLPLRDLVPGGRAPSFLDVYSDSLPEALETLRSSRPTLISTELRRVYAAGPHPPPAWIQALHRGDDDAWSLLLRAQHMAFETVLRPVWPLVQDLHRAEFTRHALTTAEHGTAAALSQLLPNTHLNLDDHTWSLPAPTPRTIRLNGRGILLHPTFHWTGHPLVADRHDHPLALTYPAGPGLPLQPTGTSAPHDTLAPVLGHTRTKILHLLITPHTTTALARRLSLSAPTISTHTTALRSAGLVTTTRAGRAVVHERTALGAILAQGGTGGRGGVR
ncbi:ArsR/SmtB family transcription factor [Streptomyces sp. NPDC059788]|uniref:ArsR/SmtB family transcription factor n=1 Tax=Streptomyces sp. NPDC059788 TaxID=3346948 RepID=UPI00364FD773